MNTDGMYAAIQLTPGTPDPPKGLHCCLFDVLVRNSPLKTAVGLCFFFKLRSPLTRESKLLQ